MSTTTNATHAHGLIGMNWVHEQLEKMADTIPADKLLHQPVEGGNHTMWILGHVAVSDDYFLGTFSDQPRTLEAWEKMFGYGREQVLGRPLGECIIPLADRENHKLGLARRVQQDEGAILGERVELTAIRSCGTRFPVELTVTRLEFDGPPT